MRKGRERKTEKEQRRKTITGRGRKREGRTGKEEGSQ